MSSSNAKPQIAMPAKRMTPNGNAAANSNNNNSNSGTTASTASKPSTPLETATLNTMQNGLTRLTPARDLTLGGRGGANANAAKKVFAPNLNAVRNKNTNVKTSKDLTVPRGGRRGGRGSVATRGGRGGGGGNSTLVQTTGVFSEGVGAVQIRKSTGSNSAYARAGEEMAIATRKRSSATKQDEKTAQQRVREEQSEEEEAVSESEAEKTDFASRPVMLREGLWESQKLGIKEEAPVITDLSSSVEVAQQLQSLHVSSVMLEEPPPQYGRYPRNVAAFLDAPQSQIFLMQLPDVLPCVTDDVVEPAAEAAVVKEEAASPGGSSGDAPTSPQAAAATPISKCSVLKQLEEGQIGKILRYRSGKVKLLLGETRFDLEMGLESGFLQELMSISTNREERSGNMVNLGPIQAKLKATPDWVHLFEQQEAAARQPRSTSIATTTTTTTTGT